MGESSGRDKQRHGRGHNAWVKKVRGFRSTIVSAGMNRSNSEAIARFMATASEVVRTAAMEFCHARLSSVAGRWLRRSHAYTGSPMSTITNPGQVVEAR